MFDEVKDRHLCTAFDLIGHALTVTASIGKRRMSPSTSLIATEAKGTEAFAAAAAAGGSGTMSTSSAGNMIKKVKKCHNVMSTLQKPKRPRTAYNYFVRDERKRIMEQHKQSRASQSVSVQAAFHQGTGGISGRMSRTNKRAAGDNSTEEDEDGSADDDPTSFENIGKIIGERWKSIKPELRAYYDKMAKEDAQRYQRDMILYNVALDSPIEPHLNPAATITAAVTAAGNSRAASGGPKQANANLIATLQQNLSSDRNAQALLMTAFQQQATSQGQQGNSTNNLQDIILQQQMMSLLQQLVQNNNRDAIMPAAQQQQQRQQQQMMIANLFTQLSGAQQSHSNTTASQGGSFGQASNSEPKSNADANDEVTAQLLMQVINSLSSTSSTGANNDPTRLNSAPLRQQQQQQQQQQLDNLQALLQQQVSQGAGSVVNAAQSIGSSAQQQVRQQQRQGRQSSVAAFTGGAAGNDSSSDKQQQQQSVLQEALLKMLPESAGIIESFLVNVLEEMQSQGQQKGHDSPQDAATASSSMKSFDTQNGPSTDLQPLQQHQNNITIDQTAAAGDKSYTHAQLQNLHQMQQQFLASAMAQGSGRRAPTKPRKDTSVLNSHGHHQRRQTNNSAQQEAANLSMQAVSCVKSEEGGTTVTAPNPSVFSQIQQQQLSTNTALQSLQGPNQTQQHHQLLEGPRQVQQLLVHLQAQQKLQQQQALSQLQQHQQLQQMQQCQSQMQQQQQQQQQQVTQAPLQTQMQFMPAQLQQMQAQLQHRLLPTHSATTQQGGSQDSASLSPLLLQMITQLDGDTQRTLLQQLTLQGFRHTDDSSSQQDRKPSRRKN